MQEQILEAALRRFSHFGINKTSLTEVAGDLAISKQVLSYYFPDKQGLISAIVEKLSLDYGNLLKAEMETCGTVQEALLKITEVKGIFFEKYFMMISQADPRDFTREGSPGNCRKSLLAKETGLLCDIFEKGIQSGELKNFDVQKTTQLLLETLSAFAHTMKEKTGIPDTERFGNILFKQQELIKIFYQAIKTETWESY